MRVELKDVKHFFRKTWLKLTRGFDCCDTYDLDGVFAKYLAKGLTAFLKDTYCYPSSMTFIEWKEILSKMIWSFKYRCSETYWDDHCDDKKSSLARMEKYQEGLDLFAKHYTHLWI